MGCFIFAGGFTVGVSKHFSILAHLEGSDYGVSTFRANFPDTPVYFPKERWIKAVELKMQPNFIYGNPPCAPWSSLGKHKWKEDNRVECVDDLFSTIEMFDPDMWAWESVTGAFSQGRPKVNELTAKALDLGYSVTWFLHDSMYITDLPQSRRRFFMICHRYELPWQMPTWEHATVSQFLKGIKPVYDNACDTKRKDYWNHLYEYSEPGGSMIQAFGKKWKEDHNGESMPGWSGDRDHRKRVPGRPNFDCYRLHPDRPMGAFTGGTRLHWKENRALALNEVMAMCGYPPDYRWVTNASGVYGLVARAVMPPVGAYLAKTVKQALINHKPTSGHVYLVDFRNPPGRNEDVTDSYETVSAQPPQRLGTARRQAAPDGAVRRRRERGVHAQSD